MPYRISTNNMIYDHIKNMGLYRGLGVALDTAFDYLEKLDADVETGTYMLDNGVRAIVSESMTAPVNEKGFEAHRRYIDVQLALRGRELIRCKPLEFVKETIAYNEEKDAARYSDEPGLDAVIGDGYFVVVWPDDAHEPLLAADGKPELVKKVVLKVPVEG